MMQLLLFGYAINTDVRHIPTVVYDQDSSAESRDLVRSAGGDRLLRRGRRRAATTTRSSARCAPAGRAWRWSSRRASRRAARAAAPPGAARRRRLRSADGGERDQHRGGLVAARSRRAVGRAACARAASRRRPADQLEPATWYNPELRTAIYVVPGLVGVILTMTMTMFTAMAIARERERGTLEQLMVSPIRKVELMLGKIMPYIAIGYVQMTLVLLFGALRVPHADRRIAAAALRAGARCSSPRTWRSGLFFSTVAQTQQQAMQMSFFFLLPNILLSGFMFPFEGMPRPAQRLCAGAAADALPAHRARHHAQGRGLRRRAPRAGLAGRHPRRAGGAGVAALPQEARMMPRPRATSPRASCTPRASASSPRASTAPRCARSRATRAPTSA